MSKIKIRWNKLPFFVSSLISVVIVFSFFGWIVFDNSLSGQNQILYQEEVGISPTPSPEQVFDKY